METDTTVTDAQRALGVEGIRLHSLGFAARIGFRALDAIGETLHHGASLHLLIGQPIGPYNPRKSIMTQTTLRTVTLETVANYRQVAERAVGAYRASGHRLLAVMSRNFDRGTSRIAPRLAETLRQTGARFGDVAAMGIDTVTARTERVIELGSAGVSLRIDRVADLVQGIENRYVATSLQTAARLSLTGAQAALTLSEKLAAGADKLAEVVGGKRARGTRAVARAKTAVKAARRAVAPAGKSADKRATKLMQATEQVELVKPVKPVKSVKPVKAMPTAKSVKRAVQRNAAAAKRAVAPVVKAKAPRRTAKKLEQLAAKA